MAIDWESARKKAQARDKENRIRNLYNESIDREVALEKAYAEKRTVENDFAEQTRVMQNRMGKYAREESEFIKNAFGENDYNKIKEDSEAMLNSPYRAHYSDFRNTSDWADMTNEERENYINKNAKDTKKNKLKHMFEFFGDASAFAANSQSSLPGRQNSKTNETLSTMNASLDKIKNDNEQMRSYNLYYKDMQDMKYGELLKDSSVASDVKAIADRNQYAKEEYNQNNIGITDAKILTENRNRYIKAADEAQQRLEEQGFDVKGLVNYYENKMASAQRDDFVSDVEQFSNEHPVIANGLSALPTLAVKSNRDAMLSADAQSVVSTFSGKYTPADNTDKAFYPSLYQSTARSTTAQNIAESQADGSFGQKALPFLYQTGMSMIDSSIAAIMPKGTGSALLSMNAFGQAYNDAAENNLDAGNAFMTAGANAVNEFFFEKYSIDRLKGMAASVSDSVLKRTFKQMGVEAGEEALTETANTLADTVINQNQSNIAQIYNDAISKGYDEEEALQIVMQSVGRQIVEAALGGALSGGVMGGAGSVYSASKQNAYYKHIGSQMNNDQINAELDYGLNSNQKSSSFKLADKIQKQSAVENAESGNDSADYSGVSVKELGKLRIKNSQSYFRNSVTEAVKNETDAKQIAKVIRNMSDGSIISKRQAEIIKDSNTAINAINESLDTSFAKEDITAGTLTQISQNMAAGSTELFDIFAENITDKTELNTKSSETRSERLNNTNKGNEYNFINYHVPATLRDNSQVLVHSALPFAQDGNEIKINTSDGYKSMVDFNFNDPDLQSIANRVSENENIGIAGMNTIFANYTPDIARKVSNGKGVEQYLRMAEMVYNEGLANDNVDFNTYLKRTSKIDVLAEVLTEEIAEKIYDAGRDDRIAYDVKQSKAKSGTEVKQSDRAAGEYKNETGKANELDSVYALLSKELGYDIVLVSSKGDNVNGYINPGSREIYITEGEAKEYHTLIHEVTHYIKLNNAEDYSTIEKAVLEWYKQENGVNEFNTLRKKYLDVYNNNSAGNTYEDINEEITCDIMADIFSTEQGINNFAEWVSNKSPKEQKPIKEAFKRFFEKLRSIINKLLDSDSLSFKGYDFAEMAEIEVDRMTHMWLSALDKATANAKQKNNTTDNGSVKYALKPYTEKQIENWSNSKNIVIYKSKAQLQQFIDDAKNHKNLNQKMYFGIASNELVSEIKKVANIDVSGCNLTLRADNILKIFKSHGEVRGEQLRGQRAITDDDIIKLPDLLGDIASVDYAGEYVDESKKSTPFVHMKSNIDSSITIGAFKQGKYLDLRIHTMFAHKKKGNNATTADVQASALTSKTSHGKVSSNITLSQTDTDVNNNSMQDKFKYSLKDSDGNELSKQQQEYFKDSKVRDGNGNLLVMYHGTPNNFSVFKNNGDGSYFTPDKNYADGYTQERINFKGNIMSVYLNITKPFDIRDNKTKKIFINDYIKGGWANGISPYSTDAEINEYIERGIDWTEGTNLIDFIEENELDYDGLIIDEGSFADGDWEYSGQGANAKWRGYSYVIFNSNQAKNIDNLNPTNNEDIRFSLKEPAEQTKELIAVHNMHIEDLQNAFALGGMPMPSIAIIKAQQGHNVYGEISLVADKNSIDPEFNKYNKVYGGDAYTPTYPSLEYKVNENKLEEIKNKVNSLLNQVGYKNNLGYMALDESNVETYLNNNRGDIVKQYRSKDALKLAYLVDQKLVIDLVNANDAAATRKSINEMLDNDGFEKWLSDLFDGIIAEKGIPIPDVDPYTRSGNKKSFWATHYEENLENVVKAMRKINNGEGAFQKNIESVAHKEYTSIDDIKGDSDRLYIADEEAYEAKQDEHYKIFWELANAVKPSNDSGFLAIDNACSVLIEAVRNYKTESGALKFIQKYNPNANYKLVEELFELVDDIANMPTGYFEAKPQRAVHMEEWKAAVVPKNIDADIKQQLADYGIHVVEYDSTDKDRTEKLNSLDDIKFSIDVKKGDYSYETLTSKPDMHITEITDGIDYKAEGITRKDIINRAIDNAKAVGYVNENGNPVIYVDDIETDIIVSKKALRHSLDRRLNVNSPVLSEIGSILKNSVRINELNSRDNNIEKSYVLIGIAKNKTGFPYTVSFVVNKVTNEISSIDVLYAVNAKKETAGLVDPQVSTLATASAISISDLLDYVNEYFPDSMSESVLRHYGYSERPNGKLGDSALYSIDVERENAQLKRKIEKLEKANQYFREELKLSHGRQVSEKEARHLANTIKEKWNCTLTVKELTNMFMQLADYGADGGFLAWNDFNERCNNIAKAILDSQKVEIAPERKAVLDYIRGFEFKLSASQKAECANAFGSFGNFYTANFGSLKFRNNAEMYIDEVWQEWSEKYPEYFDKNISDADMPIVLSDLIKTLKDTTVNEYHFDRENAEDFLTAQIMDAYYELPMRQTFADRKQQEINDLKFKHKEALEQVKAEQKAEYNKALSKVKEDYQRKNEKLWDNYIIEINANMQIAKAERERINENERKRKYRRAIHRDVNKLISMLVKPDKNKHVPSNMLVSVKSLVAVMKDNFDLSVGANSTEKRNLLRASIVLLEDSWNEKFDNGVTLSDKNSRAYDDYLQMAFAVLKKRTENKTISQLDSDELRELSKVITVTLKAVDNGNKLFADERNQSVENSAFEISAYFSDKKKDKLLKAFFNNITIGTLKPSYFFEVLGSDELTRLYKNIENGEDVYAKRIMETEQWVSNIRNKHNYKKWNLDEKHIYETQAGDRLEFTLKGLMGIYANSLRKQAKEHLLGGGFKFDIKIKAKQKFKDTVFYEDNNNSTYKLNEIDLVKIASMLSSEQIGYVKDVIDYLSTTVGGWGNEVTRRMYDIELYKEPSYYPIVTDKNFVSYSSMDYKAMRKLANSSFTKQTVTDAQNPIVLMDFEELAFKHIDQMAKYSAFTEALTDFDRVYHTFSHTGDNYQAVKSKIEAAYGKNAAAYIDKLLEDVNGNVIKTNDTGYDKWLSRFKKGAVLGSLSTVIQQPSAVVRAMSEIDPKYFTKWTFGLKNNTRTYEEIMQYAPVAFMKQMGSFDTGTSGGTVEYLIDKKTPFKKIDNALSYGAEKADQVTWVHIWNAALNETKALHKGENLTDEQLKTIAGKRFSDVVRKTQVYDSTFSRSQLMRNKDVFSKMVTSFMAEPTTTLNMAANAIVQVKRGKMSKKKGTMVMTSLVLASTLNVLLKSLVYAARNDDEDKTYFEKYLSSLPSNFIDELNPLNNIAFIKDIYSICKGYDIERADMAVFSDWYKAWEQLGSETVPTSKKIEDVVSTTASLFGVPIGNVYRDGKAIFMTLRGEATGNMHFSTEVTAEAIKEEFADTIVFDDILENVFGVSLFSINNKNTQLYDAVLNNDNERLKRLTDGKDEDQIETAIKNALIASDKRVAEAGIAYINGDMNDVISLATDLEISGFDYSIALGAIKSYANTIVSAKKAFDEIDTVLYNSRRKILTASGYDKQKIEDAIASVVIDEKSESGEALLYSADDLANAIKSNDKVSVDAMIAVNKKIDIANGYDDEEADERSQNKIKSALVIGNKDIAEAGIKYAAGDISGLLTVASELEKSGFEYNTAVKAVKSYKSGMESAKKALDENDMTAYNDKLKKLLNSGTDKVYLENAIKNLIIEAESDKESQLFSTEDLSFALESGNQQYIKTITNNMKEVYTASGLSEEKADEKIAKKLSDAQFGKSKTKNVLDKKNYVETQNYINAKMQEYISNGSSRKQAKSYIKRTLESIYKDDFIKGDADKRAEIITILTNTGLYGDRAATFNYLQNNWK